MAKLHVVQLHLTSIFQKLIKTTNCKAITKLLEHSPLDRAFQKALINLRWKTP